MNSTNKKLHIVAFDIPFPANYGGVIDVYYKIKYLKELGVHITLHCFKYGRRSSQDLENLCEKVIYYPRSNNFVNLFSKTPYISKSRNSQKLIKNLLIDKHPILFEGLHCTYPLIDNSFNNRKIMVRAHNIEHLYYKGLEQSESSFLKKMFFKSESFKLKKYEKILKKASHILTISPYEQNYFKKKYGVKAIYIPVFFNYKKNKKNISAKKYSLWHGDLNISDNRKSLEYVIEVYKNIDSELIIASKSAVKYINNRISKIKNIHFEIVNSQNELQKLIENAHINPLISFQRTGIKLRLLNILCQGKHLIVNNQIIQDTGLEECTHIANDIKTFRNKILELNKTDFSEKDISKRNENLQKFDPKSSAKQIFELIK